MIKEIQEEKSNKLIIGASIAIPVAVAILFGVKIDGIDFSFLPPIYAAINGLTSVLLISALIAVKNKKIGLHEGLMKTCLILSALFLVMYVLYHMTSEPTSYGGEYRTLYFIILVSHILLSISVIPLVLFTYVKALNKRFDKHKKLAKITFPIWLYVAVTGVVIYLMISPYYSS